MKRSIDLSLYLVTRRDSMEIEEFLTTIHAAVNGGVTVVQLREKNTSARETIDLGKRLMLLLKPLGISLIINDRVDIAHAVGADGVHLGQSDLNVAEARAILGKKAIIGVSVESLQQAEIAIEEDVDYLAASPIFHTKTKTDCAEPWGLNGLKQLCITSEYPVVAIGGINETNVREVMDCGAAGVALVSAIFDASCPKTAARTILHRMKGYAF
jgi:thiamine-phosphate pyrophosphorylase